MYPSLADYQSTRSSCRTHNIFGLLLGVRHLVCITIGTSRLLQTTFCYLLINYTSPQIDCGHSTPPLPLAIQCTSLKEASQVFRSLQGIISSLDTQPSHQRLLAAFNNITVRGLLDDGPEFYAVVIGSPPGIHRTLYVHEILLCSTGTDIQLLRWYSQSAKTAEGSWKYIITRRTETFWEALAFIIVKGITNRMPALLTAADIASDAVSSVDELEDVFQTLSVTPPSPSFTLSSSVASASSLASSSLSSTSRADASLLIYTHVRNLRGILSSNYCQTSTSRVEGQAKSLGALAVQYLASHGYGTADVTTIVRIHQQARSNDQFVLDLAKYGMPITEARFLLILITQSYKQ